MLLATTPRPRPIEPPVCPDPDKPCPGFRDHDLSFPLPEGGAARAEARSAPFFAVILKTAPKCAITEAERLAAQARFPSHKVFATRFECQNDVENNVTYTQIDAKHGFLAVYAGEERTGAEEVLAEARRHFPDANLRRMQVVFVYP